MPILRAGPWWDGTYAGGWFNGGAVDSPEYNSWSPGGNSFPTGSPVNCGPNDWSNQSWTGRADYGTSNDPGPGYGGKTFSLNQDVETVDFDEVYLYFTFYWQATEEFDLKQTVETFGLSGFGDWSVIFDTIEDGEVFNYFNTIGGGGTQTETFTLPATTLGYASFFMSEFATDPGDFDCKVKSKLESV
jgi:hypothetical protein